MTRSTPVRTAPVISGAIPTVVVWAFRDRLNRVDGHLIWQGTADKGTTPVLYADNVRYPARRVAWVIEHGTEPVGLVKTSCSVHLCVDGAHLTDERSRQADHVLYAATFHGVTLAGPCGNDAHDLAEWGYVRPSSGKWGCRGCDNARRRTTTNTLEGAVAA